MWHLRILNLKTNQVFEKDMYDYDYYSFKDKCAHSKKLRIVSEMRVF